MFKSLLVICSLIVAFAGCTSPSSKNNSAPAEKAGAQKSAHCNYTCTMHPAICSDTPGVCPKCGMELTEKE